jgi:hypothetical protein
MKMSVEIICSNFCGSLSADPEKVFLNPDEADRLANLMLDSLRQNGRLPENFMDEMEASRRISQRIYENKKEFSLRLVDDAKVRSRKQFSGGRKSTKPVELSSELYWMVEFEVARAAEDVAQAELLAAEGRTRKALQKWSGEILKSLGFKVKDYD